MTFPSQVDRTIPSYARLDALLHEQSHSDGAFGARTIRELDEKEAFPAAACEVLDRFGLFEYYVPASLGGRLVDFGELIQLVRTVARYDVTAAVAHAKTLLGAASVWVAGDPEQASWLGEQVRSGRIVSWALTEQGHGADLLAGELTAQPTDSGWALDGQKWLINNATRADLICVLARTGSAGNARGFDVFLVDKRALSPECFEPVPKVPTHGIRGADISGIRFVHAPVPTSARVGDDGAGLEIVLKALQLTRTMCTGLSLGACDHALRLATEFVQERKLYGRYLIELPRIRRILAEAAARVLLLEATSLVAGRAVHTLTSEMNVVSAVVKALVPTLADNVIAELGEVMGVRAFFSDTYADGMFAKLERDHRIVGIFDGSTAVNRHSLIKQFPMLAAADRKGRCDTDGLTSAATLSEAVEEFDPSKLSLAGRQGCSVVQGLPAAVDRIRTEVREHTAPAELGELAEALLRESRAVCGQISEHRATVDAVPASDFDLAQRYELVFAGAACVHLWLHNKEQADDSAIWREARWPRVCLSHVLRALRVAEIDYSDAGDALVDELARTGGRGMTLAGDR